MTSRASTRQALVLPLPTQLRLRRRESAFVVCYALVAGLLFVSNARQFEDESDNLLGAYLIVRGARLYADYFSSHMPFVYYLAAIPALLGAARLDQFRLFSNMVLIASTLATVWGFRRRLAPTVLCSWATITVFAHTIQWGEMLHAGTIAGYGVLVAALVFLSARDLRFGLGEQAALSAAIFVAVESSLLAVYPLALLAACYLVARLRAAWRGPVLPELRAAGSLLSMVLLPHLVVLAWFAAIGALGSFVYDAYLFNQRYYSQYLMNGSVVGMLHDWEAQYRTYLRLNLVRPFSVDFFLIVANGGAAWLTYRRRGIWAALLYYAFVALSRIRPEGAYYMSSYFSVALCLTWAAGTVGRWLAAGRRAVWQPSALVVPCAAACFLLLAAGFAVSVGRSYDLTRRPFYSSAFAPIVTAISAPGEGLFVAPYDPYLFLATERLPATRYAFYFPWQAADPVLEGDIIASLQSSRPPVVVFQQDERVNGQYVTRDWGRHLLDYLRREYVPLDAQDPVLRDVFVRPDRVEAARRAVPAGAGGPATVL